jgi:hypothetical protein
VDISPTFAETAIRTVSPDASSNTSLEVFSSSETADKVKTELDNGLNGEGYTYAVPDPHKTPPSEFFGGYTKEGAPDLVYIILDVSNIPEVLKNSGVDDSTIQKIVDETKGQKSVIFSYEGDGFVDAAFATQATPTPASSTTVAATTGTSQADPNDIPVYNGATSYEMPESILSQVRDSLSSTSAQNLKFEAYRVVAQDSELRKYFQSYLTQAGWADATSRLPSDAAKTYSDAGIIPVGPYTKGSETVLILIGKGHYASEFTGLASNENVYLIVRANG